MAATDAFTSGAHCGREAVRAPSRAGRCEASAYRRAVALLPCACCGVMGYSECVDTRYSDGGSSLHTIPLCADRLGQRGCRSLLASGVLQSEVMGCEIIPQWIADTRSKLLSTRLWNGTVPEDMAMS